MDPLSITATVIALWGTCLKTVTTLNNLREKYKHAQALISAICAESTVICASISQIQSLLLQRPEALRSQLRDRSDLVSTFDVAVTGCTVVYAVLDDELQRLTRQIDDPSKIRMGRTSKSGVAGGIDDRPSPATAWPDARR